MHQYVRFEILYDADTRSAGMIDVNLQRELIVLVSQAGTVNIGVRTPRQT